MGEKRISAITIIWKSLIWGDIKKLEYLESNGRYELALYINSIFYVKVLCLIIFKLPSCVITLLKNLGGKPQSTTDHKRK